MDDGSVLDMRDDTAVVDTMKLGEMRDGSLLRRSRRRLCLWNRNYTSRKSNPDKIFGVSCNRVKNVETDNSTLSTWSESTDATKSKLHFETLALPAEIQMSKTHFSQKTFRLANQSESYSDVKSSIDGQTNSIRDKYATIEANGSESEKGTEHGTNCCTMITCARDYEGCYGEICSRLRSFHRRGTGVSSQKVKRGIPEDIKISNANRNVESDDNDTGAWDYRVVPVGGAIQNTTVDFFKGRDRNLFGAIVLEAVKSLWMQETPCPNIFSNHESQRQRALITSSTSLALRRSLGFSLHSPTRKWMFCKALDARTQNRCAILSTRPNERSTTRLERRSQLRIQRLRKALSRGRRRYVTKTFTIDKNYTEKSQERSASSKNVLARHKGPFALALRDGWNIGKSIESNEYQVSIFQAASMLLLLQTLTLTEGNSTIKISNEQFTPDWEPKISQTRRKNRVETVRETIQKGNPQPICYDSRSCDSENYYSSSTSSVSTAHKLDDSILESYLPPCYIQKFEDFLNDATDLSDDYVSAHRNNTSKEKDDDDMENELRKLDYVEDMLRNELATVALQPKLQESKSEDNLSQTRAVAAVETVCRAVLAISSEMDEEPSSAESSESTFNIDNARKAVKSVIQRLQDRVDGDNTLENLSKIQNRMLNDLALLGSSTSPLLSNFQNSDSDESFEIQISPTESHVSELTVEVGSRLYTQAENANILFNQHAPLEDTLSIAVLQNSCTDGDLRRSPKSDQSLRPPSLMDTSDSSDGSNHMRGKIDASKLTTKEAPIPVQCPPVIHWRRQRTIWGAILRGRQKRHYQKKRQQLSTPALENGDLVVKEVSKSGEQHAQPESPKVALLLGSRSRAAIELDCSRLTTFVSQNRAIVPASAIQRDVAIPAKEATRSNGLEQLLTGNVENLIALISEFEFGSLSYNMSDLEFVEGDLLGPQSLSCKMQQENFVGAAKSYHDGTTKSSKSWFCMDLSQDNPSSELESAKIVPTQRVQMSEDSIWSMVSPHMDTFSRRLEKNTKLCFRVSDRRAHSPIPPKATMGRNLGCRKHSSQSLHDFCEPKLSMYWHSLLNDENKIGDDFEQYNQLIHSSLEKDVFKAGEMRISDEHDNTIAISPSQTKCQQIESFLPISTEEVGVEAVLLSEDYCDEGQWSTFISDLSGSTDAEYTDSESTQWTSSTVSSSVQGISFVGHPSGSTTLPFPMSAVKIGLRSVGTEAEADAIEKSYHPIKRSLNRDHRQPKNQASEPFRVDGFVGTISEIGDVLWKSILCKQQPPDSPRRRERHQAEFQVMDRLRGIRHY